MALINLILIGKIYFIEVLLHLYVIAVLLFYEVLYFVMHLIDLFLKFSVAAFEVFCLLHLLYTLYTLYLKLRKHCFSTFLQSSERHVSWCPTPVSIHESHFESQTPSKGLQLPTSLDRNYPFLKAHSQRIQFMHLYCQSLVCLLVQK